MCERKEREKQNESDSVICFLMMPFKNGTLLSHPSQKDSSLASIFIEAVNRICLKYRWTQHDHGSKKMTSGVCQRGKKVC